MVYRKSIITCHGVFYDMSQPHFQGSLRLSMSLEKVSLGLMGKANRDVEYKSLLTVLYRRVFVMKDVFTLV